MQRPEMAHHLTGSCITRPIDVHVEHVVTDMGSQYQERNKASGASRGHCSAERVCSCQSASYILEQDRPGLIFRVSAKH